MLAIVVEPPVGGSALTATESNQIARGLAAWSAILPGCPAIAVGAGRVTGGISMSDWRNEPYALVFPGQGAQFVGMGAALRSHSLAAADALAEANAVLGFDLIDLMENGP